MKTKCIDTILFSRYVEGNLEDEERRRVEKHLAQCDMCAEIFALVSEQMDEVEESQWAPAASRQVRDVLKAVSLSGRLYQKIKWVKGKLPQVPDIGMILPRFAVVRSDSEGGEPSKPARGRGADRADTEHAVLVRILDDLVLSLRMESKNKGSFDIWATVTKDEKPARNARLIFERQGGGIASRPFVGEYEVFENMAFGTYRVVLKQNAVEKGRFFIDVSEAEMVVRDDYS